MKQRTVIYTTSKKPWFKPILEDIKKIQEQSKGLKAEVYEIRTISLKSIPVEKRSDGVTRPSWSWFRKTLTESAKSYTQVVLHISEKERNSFGISKNIGGTYSNDNDNIIEFWFCADEGDKAKNYKGKSEFWRRFLHESSHGSERFLLGQKSELTHHYDYNLHAIHDLYKLYDWTLWGKLYDKITGLAAVRDALAKGQILPAVARKRDALIAECKKQGIAIRVTSGYRSCDAQDALYAQGRTTKGAIVTKAKCRESLHNYGVAFDICFDSKTPYEGPWDKVGKIGEQLGLEHGDRGHVDLPHFQMRMGYTLKDFQDNKVSYEKYA